MIQLHNYHMDAEKMRILAHISMYWIGINADIETHLKTVQCVLYDHGRWLVWIFSPYITKLPVVL